MKIPAITIYQPWASLTACGAKKYETRSWATKYRGRIAIHAAAKYDKPGMVTDVIYPIADALGFGHMYEKNAIMRNIGTYPLFEKVMKELPFGAIIATAELVNCWYIEKINNVDVVCSKLNATNNGCITGINTIKITDNEYLFGDWTPGRYAWELRDVKMLAEPIPAKGKQRLWYFDMPDDVLIKECGGNE